jgi:hypothetical protein
MTLAPLDTSRRLACPRCGAAFECSPGGACWCVAEPYRLPMSNLAAEDCLCPACLRRAAATAEPKHSTGG